MVQAADIPPEARAFPVPAGSACDGEPFADIAGNGVQTLSIDGETLYARSLLDCIAGPWLDYQFFQQQAAKLMENRVRRESELDRMIREAKDRS